jgi:hypothetical protein
MLDLDSRLYSKIYSYFLVINNTLDSIDSYLRINNTINQKYAISKFQKHLSLNLHMLKLTIEESKLIKIIETSMKEIKKAGYVETRGEVLDNYIKKISANIDVIEDNLNDFMLKKGLWSKVYNFMMNDMFGSLRQLKVELLNRYNCEEVKITTQDKIVLDAYGYIC